MEWSCSFLTWLAALLVPYSWRKAGNGYTKRPPGPPGWPIVGNIFDIGTMLHESFYKLRPQYGPVLWIKLGPLNTMVIQSAKAAAELFKNHDLSFVDCKDTEAIKAIGYSESAISVTKYGAYWRILRRLYTMELFINKRIHESAPIRQKCIDNMIEWIEEEALASRSRGGSGKVELIKFTYLMAFNVVSNLIFSREMNSEERQELFEGMNKFVEWAMKPNLADLVPFLKWLDPQRIKKNMVRDMGRLMKVITRFVNERLHEKQLGRDKVKKDFLDVLLEYEGDGKEGPHKFSETNVNILILEMFFAGSETTSFTIEWIMTELLRNPHSMKKVKEELDQVIGPNKKVKESDRDDLLYLQAVVKETFRLHPPLPLLIPRNTIEDTNYIGYLIPKNTQVFVNVWAIGMDPDSWDDPLCFEPERFLSSDIDYKGQHFELIPFGSGRRMCVGLSLGYRVVNLVVASLLQSFVGSLITT